MLPIGRELGNEPGMSVKLSASLVDLDRSGKSAVSCKDSIRQERSGVIKMTMLLLLLLPTPRVRRCAELDFNGPGDCPQPCTQP